MESCGYTAWKGNKLKHNLPSMVILPNVDPLSKVYLYDVDYSSDKNKERGLGKNIIDLS